MPYSFRARVHARLGYQEGICRDSGCAPDAPFRPGGGFINQLVVDWPMLCYTATLRTVAWGEFAVSVRVRIGWAYQEEVCCDSG